MYYAKRWTKRCYPKQQQQRHFIGAPVVFHFHQDSRFMFELGEVCLSFNGSEKMCPEYKAHSINAFCTFLGINKRLCFVSFHLYQGKLLIWCGKGKNTRWMNLRLINAAVSVYINQTDSSVVTILYRAIKFMGNGIVEIQMQLEMAQGSDLLSKNCRKVL